MIRFEGAIELYINDLAIVIFTGIKHTADWFLASFNDNNAASCTFYHISKNSIVIMHVITGFIEWAKAQIEEYASMFRKQVYTSDVESKTIEDALLITYNQSKKVGSFFSRNIHFSDPYQVIGRIRARLSIPSSITAS
jgi:hypothetical protein